MKNILIAIILTGIIGVSNINAQESLFVIEYSMGFGTGDMKEFNESASFRGMSFEYRYKLQPAMAVGFETGWNMFYDKMDYATYTQGTESLTGVQFRYTNAIPVLAAFDYYIKPDTGINPFIGLGLGTIYNNRYVDMGLYRLKSDVWQFALRPQIGVLYNLGGSDLLLAVKYFRLNYLQ